MDLTTSNTNDDVSRISEPNKEVKGDNFMGEVDEGKKGVGVVEITPHPGQGTVACGEKLINRCNYVCILLPCQSHKSVNTWHNAVVNAILQLTT